MPLSDSDRQTIAEARLIAGADTRDQQLSALSALQSPTLARENVATIAQSSIHAALLGQAQSVCHELADRCENLGAEVEAARADAETWAVWWVDLDSCKAREIMQAARQDARETALRLSEDAPEGEGYVALPIGGLPFDLAEDDLCASINRGTSDLKATR